MEKNEGKTKIEKFEYFEIEQLFSWNKKHFS